MIKKTFKAAFVLGAMLVSSSSFADLVESGHVNGHAGLTKIDGTDRQYSLDCSTNRSRCYTTYTSGDMAIHLSGGDIFRSPGNTNAAKRTSNIRSRSRRPQWFLNDG